MEIPYFRIISKSLLSRIRAWLKEVEDNPSLLDDENTVLPADFEAVTAIHEMFMKSCLMGMDASAGKKQGNNFADTDFPIETLPFEDAVQFLNTQIPLGKKSYYALDDKLRLRAFTVGRLNDGDAINRVKGILIKGLEQGGSITDFYKMTDAEILDGMGFGKGNMSYWETVYRTNTSTIQNAGRAMGFEAVPPVALELVGIRDDRQTEICRNLTDEPFIRKYDDPVWQYLWPPFHFNCRTTIRGIYDASELDQYGGPEMAYRKGEFAAPDKGFGGYPLDKESYWRLTPQMLDRAKEYGIDGEIVTAAVRLGMQNYATELVKGYKEIYAAPSGGGYVKKALNATHNDREIDLAKKAADDGHVIYLLPVNQGKYIKNPDAIIDGQVGELKHAGKPTASAVNDLIRTAHDQRASIVIMDVSDQLSWPVIEKESKARMGSVIKTIFVHWQGAFHEIKKITLSESLIQ